MTTRSPTEKIPAHLLPFIVEQNPNHYTAIDHASWRFIMKISRAFFTKHAHQKYLDGLRETGISTERIPLISEMNDRLRQFGWKAVAVSGFIPPAVFMEFLSRGILPIACDMRTLEHLAYTPAPDIVHEAAGHAPIIADPEYAEYLRHYGELAEKAIFSSQDIDVYNAVRELSDTKENPHSTSEQIAWAQKRLDEAVSAVDHVTEASQLSRMGWWTIEYGLIGEPDNPKIYGAGLLSSVGESYHCLSEKVRQVPFSMECIRTSYDITRPQPQLFVAPDFHTLTLALEELAGTMAFRRGGKESLEKARKAAITTTTVLDSGIQISGKLVNYRTDITGAPIFLQFAGPSQLAFQGQEISGQGADYHSRGYSTPIGLLRGFGKPASELSDADLLKAGFSSPHAKGRFEFESGIQLEGQLKSKFSKVGKTLILSFENCKVSLGGEVLFRPEWGPFDLACGFKIPSVFGDAADRKMYLDATGGYQQKAGEPKTNLTESNRPINELYKKVRKVRESGATGAQEVRELEEVHAVLEKSFPSDWLLRYELLEWVSSKKVSVSWEGSVRTRLNEISVSSKETAELISRGLELL